MLPVGTTCVSVLSAARSPGTRFRTMTGFVGASAPSLIPPAHHFDVVPRRTDCRVRAHATIGVTAQEDSASAFSVGWRPNRMLKSACMRQLIRIIRQSSRARAELQPVGVTREQALANIAACSTMSQGVPECSKVFRSTLERENEKTNPPIDVRPVDLFTCAAGYHMIRLDRPLDCGILAVQNRFTTATR